MTTWTPPTDHELELMQTEVAARQKLRTTLIEALVPLLKAYVEESGYDIPESFEAAVLHATGFQGGNHSHGGRLAISFIAPHEDYGETSTIEMLERGDCKGVKLVARGDWEQSGLLGALASLLADLLPKYRG
jgi:hypothetical protein